MAIEQQRQYTPSDTLEADEKGLDTEHVERIATNDRALEHGNEKHGARTYGDDEDHEHEPPVCFF